MGAAQPLAAVMAGALMLAVECQPSRIDMRLENRLSGLAAPKVSMRRLQHRRAPGRQRSRLRRPGSEMPPNNYPNSCGEADVPDAVTDQTSAHDPAQRLSAQSAGPRPNGERRSPTPKAPPEPPSWRWREQVRGNARPSSRQGVDRARLRQQYSSIAKEAGVANAFDYPGFVQAYIRPLFCRRQRPLPLGSAVRRPEDIFQDRCQGQRVDASTTRSCIDWIDKARKRIRFQGLPARICWVGLGQRHRLGLAFNAMVANGEIKAPVVIGRDHLDSGSVASPIVKPKAC